VRQLLKLPDTIQTIPAALAFWAEKTPEAPSLLALDGRVWSYRELHRDITAAAHRLVALGVQPGDQIAMLLFGSPEAYITLLAAMTIGAAVPLNPHSTADELRRDLGRLRSRLLITDGPPLATAQPVAAELGIIRAQLGEIAGGETTDAASPDPFPAVDPESIVAILHTSGTTGMPKRVMRSHRSYISCARATQRCTNLTPDDILLLSSGITTNGAVGAICSAVGTGGACVVAPAFDPSAYPNWLEAFQPTWAITTPTELNMLLAAAEREGREMIAGSQPRLRALRVGAQPMTPGTLERAEQSLNALVLESYGMTEASYITACGPKLQDRRDGSCGIPLGCAVRVLDNDGHDLPAGQSGAVAIRGETLFSGYLDDPEANAAVFLPGGWFRTGDLGSFDHEGYLYLHGRANELINRGGEKIAPAEVDRVLLSHPAVAEAATFPVPDPRLGEDIVAAVVLKPDATATARTLRGWMLDRLSPYKTPRRIWFVTHLPRTATGKVQRGVLGERFMAETSLESQDR
jgi:oxalate---CoA ligase